MNDKEDSFLIKSSQGEAVLNKFLPTKEPDAIILFIHGFNSSARIWGNDKSGFITYALDKGFICYTLNLSDPVEGSIEIMADYELSGAIEYILNENKEKLQLFIIAHSMGGLITRYYMDKHISHPNHDAKYLNNELSLLKGVALLTVPNKGISVRSSDSKIANIEKYINDFNKNRKKVKIGIVDKAFFQLLSGSKAVRLLNSEEKLETNLWSNVLWLNIIGNYDLVVSYEDAAFLDGEVEYLVKNNKFFQKEFNVTHMKNPFSFAGDVIRRIGVQDKLIEDFKISINERIPEISYIIKDPVYLSPEVIDYVIGKFLSVI